MPLSIGDKPVQRISLGTGPVKRVSLGDKLVWPNTPDAPTLTDFSVVIRVDGPRTIIRWAWTAPGDGGSPITGYTVQADRRENFMPRAEYEYMRPSTELAYGISGAGTIALGTYYARVRATNARGDGPWSEVVSAVITRI